MNALQLLSALLEITQPHMECADSIEELDAVRVIAQRAIDAAEKPPRIAGHVIQVRTSGDCGITGTLHFDRHTQARIAPEFPGDVQHDYEVIRFVSKSGRDILPELLDADLGPYLEELAMISLEGPAR